MLGRTNYVTIADQDKLDELTRKFGHSFDVIKGDDNDPAKAGKVMFSGYQSTDDGTIPSYSEEDDESVERRMAEVEEAGGDPDTVTPEETHDLMADIASCIADGEVLVYQWATSDKARYVSAGAEAYTNKGGYIGFGLDEIFKQAAEQFGVDRKTITDVSY